MIPTFLCSLAGGMLAVLAASRIEPAAHRFVRLIGIIAFAASVGVGVWSLMRGQITGPIWPAAGGVLSLVTAITAAVVMIVAPVMTSLNSVLRMASVIGGASGIAAGCAWSLNEWQPGGPWWGLMLVGQLLGAFLLGSVTVAWLLGHAYLTATQMTIAPLRRLSRMFSLAVGLRWIYLAACLVIAQFATPVDAGASFSTMLAGAWLIVALRVAVGLLAVGVFAYMVADCVRLRSTQSATGILYFASVFAYIGELSSQHLMTEIGVPL